MIQLLPETTPSSSPPSVPQNDSHPRGPVVIAGKTQSGKTAFKAVSARPRAALGRMSHPPPPEHEEGPPAPSRRDAVGGQASIPSEVAILAKNLIGCGVLSLSEGIALCANAPAAILSANIWILLLGIIFGYFCFVIAKICELTGRHTYRGIWMETMGRRGSWAVSCGTTLKAALQDLAYATILSDTLQSLLAGAAGLQVSRVACLLHVTAVALLPLCLLKNLAVLAPCSVLGTGGIILAALAMLIRYLDGSYLPGGKYHGDIAEIYQPEFGTKNGAWGTGILPFVCMVFEANVMHYNAPRFYTELKDRSLPRFRIAVSSSFLLAAILYMGISSIGFLTFGGNSNSYILNNYSSRDPLASISRMAVGLSTLMSYPIAFTGVRDGVFDILEIPISEQTPMRFNQLTLILLLTLTVISMFVTDLGLINAVGGGIVATAIVFVFPTVMLGAAVKQKLGGPSSRKEAAFALALTVIGVVLGFIGAYLAVAGAS